MKLHHTRCPVGDAATRPRHAGFTLVEILIVVGLIGTLAAIAVSIYIRAIEKARVTRAIGDITNISLSITAMQAQHGSLPDSLADVGMATPIDPWGHPYQYVNLEGMTGKGKARKDKNLVPLNTDYDLYSLGADGESATPLTAKASRDDIVRANNGGFIGLASDY
jgi:general secretion pathway protein G